MINSKSTLIQLSFLSTLKGKDKQSGFTLIEVLVTILVVTGFVLGSLQAVVLATFFRVQAQDKNEALNWVQQDLELIRYQAFILPPNIEPDSNPPRDLNCGNYGGTLENLIDTDTAHPENERISIGLNDNQRDYFALRQYSANGNTLQVTHLIAYAPASNNGNDSHPRYNVNAPYNYSNMIDVEDFRENNPNYVTTLSTEIIPDAALNCPPN
ncbi:hypothetical protein Cyast_2829 [Cyanobacterium stanieri PCC 7202]|uniref:Prepilin-type N-terminal cleavage/methylation domain-containing protein n=1 Tax=Cyanobacterium stanieri (strain ATCC 29140 / PCC 7202) TaxID=292563 RepID=K9YQX9_CYASC|nr:hypothetical protein Cyast_2829 [Cyanobacterium stanieri PCC 7202]